LNYFKTLRVKRDIPSYPDFKKKFLDDFECFFVKRVDIKKEDESYFERLSKRSHEKYQFIPIELTARIIPYLMETHLEITYKNMSKYIARIFKHYKKSAISCGVFDLETSFYFFIICVSYLFNISILK
jgi:hypothetical protein